MIEHLKRKHPDKQDKDIEYFENFKTMFTKRNKIINVFKTATTNINKGLEVSYKISRIIAQNAKPHNIGEKLLLPVIKEVLTMTSADPANILSMIPLRNDTISRRINEMANDVENQLTADLQTREFTIQLDESSVRDSDAILMAYVSNIIVQDENIAVYYKHLESLIVDMKFRFKDVENIHIPDWVINPFSADPTNAPSHIQEILIDLQANVEAKHSFEHSTLEEFWIKISSTNTFQRLWIEIRLLIMAFPTSYLVEKGFSAVSQMLTKQRNRLNICQQGDLRLYLSKLEPNIIKLCQDHQPQGARKARTIT
ncbi:SCAN domain-containing protein 3, partial [Stegodyphus mimosarum]